MEAAILKTIRCNPRWQAENESDPGGLNRAAQFAKSRSKLGVLPIQVVYVLLVLIEAAIHNRVQRHNQLSTVNK
jgi:hypothetical protein